MIHDKFAIGLVICDLVTIGHIPKFMFKLTYFFLKRGGHIKCEITGVKKYSKNSEQGILEILAGLTITSANKIIKDVMKEKREPRRSVVQKN